MPVSPQEIDAACAGMADAIYQELYSRLYPPLEETVSAARAALAIDPVALEKWDESPTPLEQAVQSWHDLADAIAHGVVPYLTANMKIVDIQTTGEVNASVSGNTQNQVMVGAEHHHPVTLTAAQTPVTFRESGDGTGHVAW